MTTLFQDLESGSPPGQNGLTALQNVAEVSDRGNGHVLEVKDVLIFATRSSGSVRRLSVPIIFKFISDKLTSNVSASNGQCDRMME